MLLVASVFRFTRPSAHAPDPAGSRAARTEDGRGIPAAPRRTTAIAIVAGSCAGMPLSTHSPPAGANRRDETDDEPDAHELGGLARHEPQHLPRERAQRDANPDLARPLRDHVQNMRP